MMTQQEFRYGEFDIVVLNPPFTRPDSDPNSSIPKAVFKGSARDKEEEQKMRGARRQKDWRVGDGNAGLASDFVDLADKMLKANGKSRMGFILPVYLSYNLRLAERSEICGRLNITMWL